MSWRLTKRTLVATRPCTYLRFSTLTEGFIDHSDAVSRCIRKARSSAAPSSYLFDGHTLGPVVQGVQALTRVQVRRSRVDKGYRGHNHPRRPQIWISGRVRGVTRTIRREMRRRAAIEPVLGHLEAEHSMDRNHLKGRDGD